MSAGDYRRALTERGFYYHSGLDLWVGPFNVSVTGYLNYDARPFADSARDESLAVIDEQLRAKRELPRPRSSGGPGPGLV